MSTIWRFDHIEDKHTLYRGKACIKKFCNILGEHEKYNLFSKGKLVPLTKKELKLYRDAKVCYICVKKILQFPKDKNYQEVRYHCH